MEPISDLPPENQEQIRPRRPLKPGPIIVVVAILAFGLFYITGAAHQININPFSHGGTPAPALVPDPDYAMPQNDPNRLNILILGIRGENDPNAADGGPLLTDSIQVFSFDKTSKKSSLISLPRDLFVKTHDDKKDKLNAVYEYGVSHSSNSLQFIKDLISRISGTYIDQVVVFDFSSFKDIVDALGGVDVTLAAPFTEAQQWGYKFSLPAGVNHLNGQSALYYARSRYSSNDFDRSRRQQEIMFAIKDKLLQLHFLSDPVKSFSIVNLIRSDIKTDIGIWDIRQLLDLANQVQFDHMKRLVISTDNLVMESKSDGGAYILLPKGGDFAAIKREFQDSLK